MKLEFSLDSNEAKLLMSYMRPEVKQWALKFGTRIRIYLEEDFLEGSYLMRSPLVDVLTSFGSRSTMLTKVPYVCLEDGEVFVASADEVDDYCDEYSGYELAQMMI